MPCVCNFFVARVVHHSKSCLWYYFHCLKYRPLIAFGWFDRTVAAKRENYRKRKKTHTQTIHNVNHINLPDVYWYLIMWITHIALGNKLKSKQQQQSQSQMTTWNVFPSKSGGKNQNELRNEELKKFYSNLVFNEFAIFLCMWIIISKFIYK